MTLLRPSPRLLLLALILGLVTSFAIAWSFALLPAILARWNVSFGGRYIYPPHRILVEPGAPDRGELYIDYFTHPGTAELGIAPSWHPAMAFEKQFEHTYPRLDALPADYLKLWGPPPYPLPAWGVLPTRADTCSHITTEAWGWPIVCLCGTETTYIDQWKRHEAEGYTQVLKARHPTSGYWERPQGFLGARWIRLPLRPYATGLIADTLIFTAWWIFLATLIRLLKHRHRRRKGLCPSCAYDLRATPITSPCPECGHPTGRRG